jgi:tRNA threonylcarbamoyladenosine biosynthesis protein TsaB
VTAPTRPVLAFDFGSPWASAALAVEGRLLGAAESERGRDRDQAELLPLLDELLRRCSVPPRDLGGVVALCGPGSFTGVRVACATALGLAQAHALPAAGVPTLEALALAAPPGARRILAVVDALRGEWFVQPFEREASGELRSLAPPAIRTAGGASDDEAEVAVGPEAERFAVGGARALTTASGRPLAATVAIAASLGRWEWDDRALLRPHHLRAAVISR